MVIQNKESRKQLVDMINKNFKTFNVDRRSV